MEVFVNFWQKIKEHKLLLSLALIFLLTFTVGQLTPLHSDDFGYTLQRLSFKNHYNHYMGWSGRLVADWCSDIILNLPYHWMMVAVQSVIMAGYSYFVAAIPAAVLKKQIRWYFPLVVFAFYWISNTNLGQTTFWIVGSCNYLVTNFFTLGFIYFCVRNRKTTNSFVRVAGFVLGVVAGCTNENTSVMLVCLLPCIGILLWLDDEDIGISNFILWWIGSIFGAALLLLAPGNYKRLAHPAFKYWRGLTLLGKIKAHWGRMWNGSYWFFPLGIAMLLNWVGLFVTKKVSSNKKVLLWFAIFLLAFIGSEIVMIAAPGMPPRSFNGPLTFLLVAFSFLLHIDFQEYRKAYLINAGVGVCAVFAFVMSYALVVTSYGIAYEQNRIRIATVMYNKSVGVKRFAVPGYYFPRLLKNEDMYDMYHSGAMGRFYGVNRIDLQRVKFDYSLVNTGKRVDKVQGVKDLGNYSVYVADSTLLLPDGRIAIYSTDKTKLDKVVGVKFRNKRSKCITAYELQPSVALQGLYCRGTTIMKDFKYVDYDVTLY